LGQGESDNGEQEEDEKWGGSEVRLVGAFEGTIGHFAFSLPPFLVLPFQVPLNLPPLSAPSRCLLSG
jgi:hypothetical protein